MTDVEVSLALPDSVLVRIRDRLPEFTGALLRVAEQVLSDPGAAARATIVDLAERSGTSPATVTRFCRAVGFPGYAELRLGLAGESGWATDPGRATRSEHPLDTVLQQIMADDPGAMRATAARLDLRAVAAAADAIAAARRVDIYGASGSVLVAGELQFCLHRIGVAAWSWKDIHDGLASAATLGPPDVVIGVSHTGESRATIEILAGEGRPPGAAPPGGGPVARRRAAPPAAAAGARPGAHRAGGPGAARGLHADRGAGTGARAGTAGAAAPPAAGTHAVPAAAPTGAATGAAAVATGTRAVPAGPGAVPAGTGVARVGTDSRMH